MRLPKRQHLRESCNIQVQRLTSALPSIDLGRMSVIVRELGCVKDPIWVIIQCWDVGPLKELRQRLRMLTAQCFLQMLCCFPVSLHPRHTHEHSASFLAGSQLKTRVAMSWPSGDTGSALSIVTEMRIYLSYLFDIKPSEKRC